LTTTGKFRRGSEKPCEFMRRTTLIFGLFLTLTAGVWGSALAAAVAAACCADEMNAHAVAPTSPASGEHDCCRAKLGEPNAPLSDSTNHSHAATRHKAATHYAPSPEPQAADSHAQTDCEGAKASAHEATVAAFVGRGRSCLECCAGRTGQMPTTATISAPEPNRVKRAAAHVSVAARDLFAPDAHGVSHLAPSQHAPPPASRERRHILISVFLI
jgi:hypothetical protein